MTAVEFLYERLERMIPRTALYDIDKESYFEQAKAIEKEQIVDAFEIGYENGACVNEGESIYYGSKYYKKTFNK